jgi:hypothetical protein
MKKLVVWSVAVLFAAGSAQATSTFYGEDAGTGSESVRLAAWPNSDAAAGAFTANITNYGVESFEAFADDTPLDGQGLVFTNGVTATFYGSMSVNQVPTGTNGLGRYPTDGINYLEGSTAAFRIEFDQEITAFGFYGIDIGDFLGKATIELYAGDDLIWSGDVPSDVPAAYSSVLFLGIGTDTAFDTVVIKNSYPGPIGNGDGFGFDEMIVGSYVPAPSAILLGGIGTCLISWLRRRKAL